MSDIEYISIYEANVCMCVFCELSGGIMSLRDHYLHRYNTSYMVLYCNSRIRLEKSITSLHFPPKSEGNIYKSTNVMCNFCVPHCRIAKT